MAGHAVTKGFGRAFHRHRYKTRRAAFGRRWMKRAANRHMRRVIDVVVVINMKNGEFDFDPIPLRYHPYSDWDVI